MEKGLKKKTGKSLDYWITVVKDSGQTKHKAIIDFLKTEHAFSHGYANFVALKARKSDAASMSPQELLANQYQGKEKLVPIYSELLALVKTFGEDVTITPKKDSVSVIRKKQFALIKPATKSRIDLGLKLKGKEINGRLQNSGPFGAMCTHRVRLTSIEEVDLELGAWLRVAYEEAT